MSDKILYIVVACYNEEQVLPMTIEKTTKKLSDLIDRELVSNSSKVLFVNDCSKDKTWELICSYSQKNDLVTGISLAHNSGEQNAFAAGMTEAVKFADFVVTIDADLQDDLDSIDRMIEAFYEGNEIVYGIRAKRSEESFLIRLTASSFYKLMKVIGTEQIAQHSQYRLMSKRAVQAMNRYKESFVFLPALIPLMGFKHTVVCYEGQERDAGKSHYNFKSLFYLALRGITSFSETPIRFIGLLAVISVLIGIIMLVYALVYFIWTSSVSSLLLILGSLWLVGGFGLLSVRIIGEYILTVSRDVKGRPRYYVLESLLEHQVINDDSEQN